MDDSAKLIEVLRAGSRHGLVHRGFLQRVLQRLSIDDLDFDLLLEGMGRAYADRIDVTEFIRFLFGSEEDVERLRGKTSAGQVGETREPSPVQQALPSPRQVTFQAREAPEPELKVAKDMAHMVPCRTLTAGRMPSMRQIDDYPEGEPGSEAFDRMDYHSETECSDVEELEPAALTTRRGGVSAIPTGAFNVRFVNWVSPMFEKDKSHQEFLLRSLAKCPFFWELDKEILQALVDTMEIEEFQPGEAVYTKGDVGRSGYVLIAGHLTAETDATELGNVLRRSSRSEVDVKPGDFFGEHTMLWGFRRRMTVIASKDCDTPAVAGKLKRDVYFNIVTRSAMHERSKREKYLRTGVPMFETFDSELITTIADIMRKRSFAPGEKIVQQGEEGGEFFIILKGECVATIKVAKVGADGFEEHPVRYYNKGERFGELAFINRTPRAATVTANTNVTVLSLDRAVFERVVGSLDIKQKENYASDPRKILADFYSPGTGLGPCGAVPHSAASKSSAWFAVYRPTSRDALAKMLNLSAVGKGLNVKGKSAKRNQLSGFVPFVQISSNQHKRKLGPSPLNSRVTVYFQTHEAAELARLELDKVMRELSHLDLEPITSEDSYEVWGLEVPERVLREAFIDRQDVTFQVGWETGRASEPAFMEMNLHAIRSRSLPKVVLYQYDNCNPMNPHGLLIAYAEAKVKPVVSDFDTFTIGSRGMVYEPICEEQCALMRWSLDCTERILRHPGHQGWNSRWLEVLEKADKEGFHPEIPEFGFGDPTSYRLTKAVIKATKMCGAVRHGAECFNFYFPQELDCEYLIIWDGFDGKPWAYRNASGLLEFLLERVSDGYSFPLNPVWPVRDEGWYEVFEALRKSDHAQDCLAAWFPDESIIRKIESLHAQYPEGFQEVMASDDELQACHTGHWRVLQEFVRRKSHS
ncbi:unnamed protein product [Effrenium voratum]|nr:unnamed protein product [Effrenium voratum]